MENIANVHQWKAGSNEQKKCMVEMEYMHREAFSNPPRSRIKMFDFVIEATFCYSETAS